MAKKRPTADPASTPLTATTSDVLREPAEVRYADQLEALRQNDAETPPQSWGLSPRSVLLYVTGGKTLRATIEWSARMLQIHVDGTGIESDPPAGSPVPELVRVDGPVTLAVDGQIAAFDADVGEATEWTVLATSPDDVMVAFDVHVLPAETPDRA